MYSSTDCWGCRATPATFCASCVHKAISERHARLKEIQQDKAKLEEAMAGNMKRREALQRQDQARRRHSATAAALQAELEATRRDTERLAKEAETLRQTMRHSKSLAAQQQQQQHAGGPATSASTVGDSNLDERLTKERRRLLRELYFLRRDIWEDAPLTPLEIALGVTSGESAADTLASLASLIDAPSLSWELRTQGCPLWDDKRAAAGHLERALGTDEWDVVETSPSSAEEDSLTLPPRPDEVDDMDDAPRGGRFRAMTM